MAATIKDIAKKTGLGVATISSYLNGGHVREYNRVKIEAAIEELHFEVNEVARGLKTNSTKTIGIVIPELQNLFFTEIVSKATKIWRQEGYAAIVCECHSRIEEEKEAIAFLQKKRVDGLLLSPVSEEKKQIQKLAERKPVVLIDRFVSNMGCSGVIVNNRDAVRSAVRMLAECGHRKIGFIGGPRDLYTARERLEGYRQAMRELERAEMSQRKRQKPDEKQELLVCETDYTIAGGSQAVRTLLQAVPDVTALLVSNYETTVGALIALNELGKRVPEDISIVGYDNVDFARAFHPRLTIVTQPTEEIARQAACMMLEQLAGYEQERKLRDDRLVVLQAGMLQGESVRYL